MKSKKNEFAAGVDFGERKEPLILSDEERNYMKQHEDEIFKKFEEMTTLTPKEEAEERKEILKLIEEGYIIGGVDENGDIWTLR